MQNAKDIIRKIDNGEYNETFKRMYKDENYAALRYKKLIKNHCEFFKDDRISVFSAPGRTEIIGNHTDHQNGCAIGASVNLDIIGAVSYSNDNYITIKSEGYNNVDRIDITDLIIKEEEKNTSSALIRGCASKLKSMGYDIKGFNMYTTSNVLKGSGLSSSAAFENIVVTVMNNLFCNKEVDSVTLAKIGKYAENEYFGKPSGMLDQTASSVGGFVYMDFENKDNPYIEKIDCDFLKYGYSLCIVDTGGNHAALTDEYAAIFGELREVSEYFGKNVIREVSKKEFIENICDLRKKVSDRAVLRALHIFDENERVEKLKNSLKENDFIKFLGEVKKSGESSYKYLQNVYSSLNTKEQSVSLALYFSENILGDNGVSRVHGGGFGGTIQAFVKNEYVETYKEKMEKIFGKDKCYNLFIRQDGGVKVI